MFDTIFDQQNNTTIAAPLTKAQLAEAFLHAPPSAKIRFAIADLEATERSKRYTIDMDTWHAMDNSSGTCHVCLAGAVMANRHTIEPHQTYVGTFGADGPGEYATNERWDDIFSALDEFRSGYVEAFLTIEGTVPNDKAVAFAMAETGDDPYGVFPGHVDYEEDAPAFKAWARGIADKLEAIGA